MKDRVIGRVTDGGREGEAKGGERQGEGRESAREWEIDMSRERGHQWKILID